MMRIYCWRVGAAGGAFSVPVDEDVSVDVFKEVIKEKKKSTITCDADDLQLYLAKKDGEWLTNAEAALVSDVVGLTRLSVPQETLKQVGLSADQVQIQRATEVHVLVVVPTEIPLVPVAVPEVPSVPVAPPRGPPEVDISSCDALLAFLEAEMIDKSAIASTPHILAEEGLQFRLVGREAAIQKTSECFQDIISFSKTSAIDRTRVPLPVCSGISGLGKTRMLEEGATLLEDMNLDPKHVFRVIIPYFNGFIPQPVEKSLPIVASFSWRLLYRFFLDKNCAHSFETWFQSRLPRNGSLLLLKEAIEVIERKLRDKLQDPAPLYLFLGVDEYQQIDNVVTPPTDSKSSTLRALVEAISAVLCTQPSSMVVLPMFAGTDLAVIKSIANSSYYVTTRLPMNLLSMDQVFSIVESSPKYADLLQQARVCRNLFFLGGVPRWVVEYVTALKKDSVIGTPVKLDRITSCFSEIHEMYVSSYLDSLKDEQLVRLAAFAVSGRLVSPNNPFDRHRTWSRLRDSSLCVLVPRAASFEVRVPYALLKYIGSCVEVLARKEDQDFASALKDMGEMVDSVLFDLQPWQLWEMFGACFYAVRINALLVLGYSTVTLGDLLPGTKMSSDTRAISVKLVPSRVISCAGAFGASTPRLISRKGNELEKIDWASGGHIVVNGDSGAGVDIFFALQESATGRTMVVVDQRKRQFGRFQPSHAREYLKKLGKCPRFLVASGARLVRGVMNCVSPSNLATYAVPDDCFILSRDESERFHGGTLAYHPACSPVISINSACKTALKTAFDGEAREVEQVVEEIMRKRQEPSGGFSSSDELESFIRAKRLKVYVHDRFAEFSS